MSFYFPLATVQRLRELVEDREERLLQDIQFEIAQARTAISTVDSEVSAINRARIAQGKATSTALDIHAIYGQLESLKLKRKELEERLEKLEDLRQKQMVIYQEARKGREMLDDIHDNRRAVYDFEMNKREQRTIDDTFGAQRARRQSIQ